jgi:hypothetical protein
MKMQNLVWAAGCVVVGMNTAATADNIANGDFAGNAPSYTQNPGYNQPHDSSNPIDPSSWTDNGIGNAGLNGPDVAIGSPFTPVSQSTPAVDFGFLQYPGAAYYQTFAVIPGETYAVSYTDGARYGESGDQDTVSIEDGSYDGTTLASQYESPSGQNFTVEPSFEFTAASDSATIVLENTTLGPSDFDRTIDFTDIGVRDVSQGDVIQAVPEPASIGLLAVGGLSVLARRRRRCAHRYVQGANAINPRPRLL